MPASQALDPSRCPLCNEPNGCVLTDDICDATTPCWCATVRFPPELLERVPEAAQGKACICARCAQTSRHA